MPVRTGVRSSDHGVEQAFMPVSDRSEIFGSQGGAGIYACGNSIEGMALATEVNS